MLPILSSPDAIVELLGGIDQTMYLASGAGFIVGALLANFWGRRG